MTNRNAAALQAYVWACGASAALLLAGALSHPLQTVPLLLFLAVVAGNVHLARLQLWDGALTKTPNGVVTLAAGVIYGPALAVIVAFANVLLLAPAITGGPRARRVAVNLFSQGSATAAAATVFHLIAPAFGTRFTATSVGISVLAAVAATTVYDLINQATVAAAISLHTDAPYKTTLSSMVRSGLPPVVFAGTVSTLLFAALVVQFGPAAIALLSLPGLATFAAYRAAAAAAEARHDLDELLVSFLPPVEREAASRRAVTVRLAAQQLRWSGPDVETATRAAYLARVGAARLHAVEASGATATALTVTLLRDLESFSDVVDVLAGRFPDDGDVAHSSQLVDVVDRAMELFRGEYTFPAAMTRAVSERTGRFEPAVLDAALRQAAAPEVTTLPLPGRLAEVLA